MKELKHNAEWYTESVKAGRLKSTGQSGRLDMVRRISGSGEF